MKNSTSPIARNMKNRVGLAEAGIELVTLLFFGFLCFRFDIWKRLIDRPIPSSETYSISGILCSFRPTLSIPDAPSISGQAHIFRLQNELEICQRKPHRRRADK